MLVGGHAYGMGTDDTAHGGAWAYTHARTSSDSLHRHRSLWMSSSLAMSAARPGDTSGFDDGSGLMMAARPGASMAHSPPNRDESWAWHGHAAMQAAARARGSHLMQAHGTPAWDACMGRLLGTAPPEPEAPPEREPIRLGASIRSFLLRREPAARPSPWRVAPPMCRDALSAWVALNSVALLECCAHGSSRFSTEEIHTLVWVYLDRYRSKE
jgi:hypothetical protein